MNDEKIASIGRRLAAAMMIRARSRLPEDQKFVLMLQTELCTAVQLEYAELCNAVQLDEGPKEKL